MALAIFFYQVFHLIRQPSIKRFFSVAATGANSRTKVGWEGGPTLSLSLWSSPRADCECDSLRGSVCRVLVVRTACHGDISPRPSLVEKECGYMMWVASEFKYCTVLHGTSSYMADPGFILDSRLRSRVRSSGTMWPVFSIILSHSFRLRPRPLKAQMQMEIVFRLQSLLGECECPFIENRSMRPLTESDTAPSKDKRRLPLTF